MESKTPIVNPAETATFFPERRPQAQHTPWLTWIACVACVAVFGGLVFEPDHESWQTLSKWGYLPPDRIRNGAYWALLSSVFVHIALWHVAFNLYWLYKLGAPLERAIGSIRWLVFFILAAVVSSGWEFGLTDTTGIGASGVVYAIFGFMWMARKRFQGFNESLDQRTIFWFVVWLLGCVALTLSHVWAVGNAAHISGLAFGLVAGAYVVCERRRRLFLSGLAVLVVCAVLPLFWAPWSADWTSYEGVRAHERGDYRSAVKWYQRSLRLGQDKVWCWSNLALAYDALEEQTHYNEAIKILRGIDKQAASKIEVEIMESKQK